MKKKKFKRAQKIEEELKKLNVLKSNLDCGDFKVSVSIVEPEACDDDIDPDSEILRKEIDQSTLMANAVISDSINRRVADLKAEFKTL